MLGSKDLAVDGVMATVPRLLRLRLLMIVWSHRTQSDSSVRGMACDRLGECHFNGEDYETNVRGEIPEYSDSNESGA